MKAISKSKPISNSRLSYIRKKDPNLITLPPDEDLARAITLDEFWKIAEKDLEKIFREGKR